MTAPKIRADYDQLNQIAQRFGQEADAQRQTLQSLRQNMSVLEGGDWIGQGARAFYAEMNSQVLPSMQRLASALSEAQRATGQILQIAQNAEREAADALRRQAPAGEGGSGGGGASGSGAGGAGGSSSLMDKLLGLGEKLLKPAAKFVLKKAIEFAEKQGVRNILKELGEKGAEWLGKQGLKLAGKSIGKAIPLPLVDVAVDFVVNAGFNIWEFKDKGLFGNPEFWGTMMKDTTVSITSNLAKWGVTVAAGLPTGGVGAIPALATGVVVGAGMDALFGNAMTDFYTKTPIAQGLANASRWIGDFFGGSGQPALAGA